MSEKRFEKLIFYRVPFWVVALLSIFAFLGAIAFGNIAIHAYKGGKKAGPIGDAVLTLSTIPEFIKKLDNEAEYLRVTLPVHDGKKGFSFNYQPGSRDDAGYLLLNKYDGDERRGLVELWDLNNQIMIHRWIPPIDEINSAAKNFKSNEIDLFRDRSVRRMLPRHAVLTEDGSIVFAERSPLSKIDACGQIVWIQDDALFHHAIERDSSGAFWLSSKIEPASIPRVDPINFFDDAITKVSADGEILFQRSVAGLFLKNNMDRYVYGAWTYEANPIHLNDVQPVETDGRYWKKGDVFLSLRNHSIIMLYRPTTDEILWYKQGPWSHQHDVDVVDDHRISIFDNHSYNFYPFADVSGNSDVVIYDFDTDKVESPWSQTLAELEFQSTTEGLHTIRPNGNLFVEEQNRARILELANDGTVLWEYVNRAEKDGALYRPNWSRIIEPDIGRPLEKYLADKVCSDG